MLFEVANILQDVSEGRTYARNAGNAKNVRIVRIVITIEIT
ncbi:hypothetical protein QUB60_02565 [Microcoleus sp. A2-C5]|nr:hypothetical protein [Lyngbya sp. CCAP 1446/10]